MQKQVEFLQKIKELKLEYLDLVFRYNTINNCSQKNVRKYVAISFPNFPSWPN